MSRERTHGVPSGARDEGPGDTAILTIDLDAVAANYRAMRDLAAPAECAAVVKADAYGLGMARIAPVLWRAGCKTFFVATLEEGEHLRTLLPEATIYVLAGLMPGTAELYRTHGLRPVLNSADEVGEWAAFCIAHDERLACAVHIDSGMNRLGLSAEDVEQIAAEGGPLAGADAVAGDEPSRLRRRARPSEERWAATDVRPASRASSCCACEPRQFPRHPARSRLYL